MKIRLVPIAEYVRQGSNTIELRAQRFNVLCEIDRLYLRGNFTLQQAARALACARGVPSLDLGDWTRQGLSFYRGSVRYRYTVQVPPEARRWQIATPAYEGALVRVFCDNQPVGHNAFPLIAWRHRLPLPARTKSPSRSAETFETCSGRTSGVTSPPSIGPGVRPRAMSPQGQIFDPLHKDCYRPPKSHGWPDIDHEQTPEYSYPADRPATLRHHRRSRTPTHDHPQPGPVGARGLSVYSSLFPNPSASRPAITCSAGTPPLSTDTTTTAGMRSATTACRLFRAHSRKTATTPLPSASVISIQPKPITATTRRTSWRKSRPT